MENEWITASDNLFISQEQNVEWKEQVSEEYMECDFIYRKLNQMQNYCLGVQTYTIVKL